MPGQLLKSNLPLLLLLLLLSISCKKNKGGAVYPSDQMNAEEAFILLEGALKIEAEGLMREMLLAIDVLEQQLMEADPNPHCEIADNTNVTDIFDNDFYQGTFKLNRQWILNCQSQSSPDHLIYSWEGDITYDSRKLSDDVYTDGSLKLSQTGPEGNWQIEGNYERTGRQYSKLLTGNIYETSFFMRFNELIVDSSKKQSTSGNATFDISGVLVGGRTFFLGGDIEFFEKGEARVAIGKESFRLYPF